MLRRPITVLSITAEDIADFEDRRAQEAARQRPTHRGILADPRAQRIGGPSPPRGHAAGWEYDSADEDIDDAELARGAELEEEEDDEEEGERQGEEETDGIEVDARPHGHVADPDSDQGEDDFAPHPQSYSNTFNMQPTERTATTSRRGHPSAAFDSPMDVDTGPRQQQRRAHLNAPAGASHTTPLGPTTAAAMTTPEFPTHGGQEMRGPQGARSPSEPPEAPVRARIRVNRVRASREERIGVAPGAPERRRRHHALGTGPPLGRSQP